MPQLGQRKNTLRAFSVELFGGTGRHGSYVSCEHWHGSFLLPVAMPGAPSSFLLLLYSKALVTRSDALVPSSFLLPVAMPGAPSSFLLLLVSHLLLEAMHLFLVASCYQ